MSDLVINMINTNIFSYLSKVGLCILFLFIYFIFIWDYIFIVFILLYYLIIILYDPYF